MRAPGMVWCAPAVVWWGRWCVAVAVTFVGAPAGAHGLDVGRVELVLQGDVVEAVATPPVGFVRAADADGDERLTLAEVNARRDELRRALVAALDITDDAGRAGALERSDVSLPHGHDGGEAAGQAFLRVTVRLRWAMPPRAVRVRCGFAGERAVTVYATRAEAATSGVLTLVGDPELARLASPDASVTLLRRAAPPPAAPPPAPRASPWPWLVLALSLGAAWTLSRAHTRRHSPRLATLRPDQGDA